MEFLNDPQWLVRYHNDAYQHLVDLD